MIQLNDLQASERLANTFSRLVVLDPVLDQAAAELDDNIDAELLRDRVSVANPRGTQLLEVSATHASAETAAEIANSVSRAFIDSNEAQLGSRPGVVAVVEPARTPKSPVSPRTELNMVLGAVAGILVAATASALAEYLDDTVKSASQVAQLTRLPTLGSVPEQLRVAAAPESSVAEAFRSLRTALSFHDVPSRGRHRIVRRQPAPADLARCPVVVQCELLRGAVSQQVSSAIADVRNPRLRLLCHRRDKRRRHRCAERLATLSYGAVCGHERITKRLPPAAPLIGLSHRALEGIDSHLRRDTTVGEAAQAVGYREQDAANGQLLGESRILVCLADAPHVRCGVIQGCPLAAHIGRPPGRVLSSDRRASAPFSLISVQRPQPPRRYFQQGLLSSCAVRKGGGE